MKTLIAGFGNIFFSDDAFGTEVARALALQSMPPGVTVRDFGIRGMHAAFEMLDGYDLVILVDAVPRGGTPGTLYVIDPQVVPDAVPDAHAMELHNLLALYERMARDLGAVNRPEVVIVGCEPESTAEGIGLSDAARAAIPRAAVLVTDILAQRGTGAQTYEKA